MTVVIEDPETVREIERRASAAGQTPVEVVSAAFKPMTPKTGTLPNDPSVEEILAFVRDAHLEAINEDLSDDAILGYGPHGNFE